MLLHPEAGALPISHSASPDRCSDQLALPSKHKPPDTRAVWSRAEHFSLQTTKIKLEADLSDTEMKIAALYTPMISSVAEMLCPNCEEPPRFGGSGVLRVHFRGASRVSGVGAFIIIEDNGRRSPRDDEPV